MAMVNVDLSEYDMLREAKTKAEEELKNSKKEIEECKTLIKGLKDSSKVIIHNKLPYINSDDLASIIKVTYDLEAMRKFDLLGYRVIGSYDDEVLKMSIYTALQKYIKRNVIEDSYQYVNFEDVKDKVESHLNMELVNSYNKAIREAEQAKNNYEKEENNLNLKYSEIFNKKYKEYEESNEKKLKELTECNNSLKKEIDDLKSINKELSKSLEERQKEASEELKAAQEKYNNLMKSSNKSLFSKIFG